jgi:beta-lysine 5,6-aminomutase alpha subunit
MVAEARELARVAGQPIVDLATRHTTVSVERAVLRLAGLEGADDRGMPWVNRLVDGVRESTGLEHGVALPAWDALLAGGYPTLRALATDVAAGTVKFRRAPTLRPRRTRRGPRSAGASPRSTAGGPSGPR